MSIVRGEKSIIGKGLELAERGWPVEKISAGANLVEAYAEADIIYTQKAEDHAAAASAASAAATELEPLYIEARGYTKDTLAKLPPKSAPAWSGCWVCRSGLGEFICSDVAGSIATNLNLHSNRDTTLSLERGIDIQARYSVLKLAFFQGFQEYLPSSSCIL